MPLPPWRPQLCFLQEDALTVGGPTCLEPPAGCLKLQLLPLCAAPHGLLCSWALGRALINARRRTPTAAFRFFLAAEAKSQVQWGESVHSHTPTENLCSTWPSGKGQNSWCEEQVSLWQWLSSRGLWSTGNFKPLVGGPPYLISVYMAAKPGGMVGER